MSPIAATSSTVAEDVRALSVEVARLAGLVEQVLPHVLTPDEVAELERLRVLRASIQALYDAGGAITRAKVSDALIRSA